MSDQMMLLIGLGGVFLGVVLLLATIGVITSERQAVGRSLAAVEAIQTAPKALRSELDQPFRHRVVVPVMGRLSGIGRTLSPDGQSERIKRRLDLAGNPPQWTADRVFAFKMLGLLFGLIGGIGLSLAFGAGALLGLGLTLLLMAAGFYTADIVLLQISQTRQQRIQSDLPDALDLLSISVEAGLGFDAALAQLARNTTGPLADEFFRVLQEMQIGTGRSDAMRGLGDRTTVPELRGFVTAMVQADAFGVPVANVLRVQAADMRVKRSQRAEEKAQKVPVKILFPLIFCILPALFIVVIGPAAITIFRNVVQGQSVAGAARRRRRQPEPRSRAVRSRRRRRRPAPGGARRLARRGYRPTGTGRGRCRASSGGARHRQRDDRTSPGDTDARRGRGCPRMGPHRPCRQPCVGAALTGDGRLAPRRGARPHLGLRRTAARSEPRRTRGGSRSGATHRG